MEKSTEQSATVVAEPARAATTAAIENLLNTHERIPAPGGVAAWAGIADQQAWNDETARDPIAFWTACGERLAWAEPPHTTFSGTIGDARWYDGGRLNATVT